MSATPTVPPPAPVVADDVARVLDLLRTGNVAVLTGAGMSTASGIPDYRGPDGERRVQPMQYAEFLADPRGRQRYWARAFAGWERFAAAGPNSSHYSVARWQDAGALTGIITQNVDGLHQAAGARDVIELHGNLAHVVCLDCAQRYSRAVMHRWLSEANPDFVTGADATHIRPDGDVALSAERVASFVVVRCPACGHDRLKPDVVFFGGSVERPLVEQSFALVERSEALLVLGSSLQVMSGYRFVRRAHALGMPIAVITRGMTRGQQETTVHVDALLAEVVPSLARELAGDHLPDSTVPSAGGDGVGERH
ncbi:MAG: Sir2 family NAD-dependent protein deacetylase [Ornithinimicrobium sp.]